MRYTTKAEYGILILLHLAANQGSGPQSGKEIARSEGLSQEYVEKLASKLKQFGLVDSKRGAAGGYTLATEPEKITLKHIIEALDGATFQTFCADEVRENIVCNHLEACGIGNIWSGLKLTIDEYLGGITLASLAEGHAIAAAGR